MKLRCISNICENYTINDVTIGETYEGCEGMQGLYRIVDDTGSQHFLPKDMFEIVDEVATELELPEDFMDEIIGLELIKEDLEKEEVKSMRTLKERILGKINYRAIAEQIWDRIEEEVIEEVALSFDEDNLVEDMLSGYRSDFVEVASEAIIEEFNEDIDSFEIEARIKDIAKEKAYE